ncbi:hypothetical protein [Glycomyces harbinensis]|uniref:Uncharacterized protein n=1 Tax=Glycomyces harbinensis TaxID=58114 RepID=A0A1G6SPI6_9ACTN|nr:hypothetical protein [Glycomyces harbinensis]SDD18075.1 hypothetical protein SAMN05216270_102183 [Glycomyces harbinensis]
MTRTYDIDEIDEMGSKVLVDLSHAYWDLAHAARAAGAAQDSMFQEASATTNTGPGSGGAPVSPPGASEVAAAWRTLYMRFEKALSESGANLEHLSRAMKLTAQSMREAEEGTEFDLSEIQGELDGDY